MSWMKRKKWLVMCSVLAGIMLSSLGIQVVDKGAAAGRISLDVGNEKVITIGHVAYAAGSVDYTYDGVADNVQFQAALNALPATGGRLVDVSSVQKNFAATVTRAINNVVIEGAGFGSYFANNGVTALFTAGGNGWKFSDLRTDAGGIAMGATTGWMWINVNDGSGTVYDLRTPAGSIVNGSFTASTLTSTVAIGTSPLTVTSTTKVSNLNADLADGYQATRSATWVIAASDATVQEKAQADVVVDGIADQTEIQAAIDAGYKHIKLSTGTFTVNAADFNIVPTSGLWLQGSGWGTIIKLADGVNADTEVITKDAGIGVTLENVIISDLQLDGNRAGQAAGIQQGILLSSQAGGTSRYHTIRNVYIHDFRSSGAHYQGSTDSYIQNSHFVNNANERQVGAIDLCSGTRIEIASNFFIGNYIGIWMSGTLSEANVITGNTIRNSAASGISGEFFAGKGDGTGVDNIISNNEIYDNSGDGIILTMGGNTITSNRIYDNTGDGIELQHWVAATTISGIKISGNLITGNSRGVYGVYLLDSTISDNRISGTSSTGIVVTNSSRVSVLNNVVRTAGANGITISRTAGTPSDNVVQGNVSTGATTYGIRLDNSNITSTIVRDNVVSGTSGPISDLGTGTVIARNVGYIAPGEIRTASGSLTAGNANAIAFSWNNPEAQDILVNKVVVEVTTGGGTVGSHLDVGIADDATGTNRGTEFFDDLLLNSVQIDDSWVAGDGGTQTKWVLQQDNASATDDWIVGQILDANAAALVGRWYVEYAGR